MRSIFLAAAIITLFSGAARSQAYNDPPGARGYNDPPGGRGYADPPADRSVSGYSSSHGAMVDQHERSDEVPGSGERPRY